MKSNIDWDDPATALIVVVGATIVTILVGMACELLFFKQSKLIEERAVVEQTCLFSFGDSLARAVVLRCSHGRISFKDDDLWSSVRQGEELTIYYSTVVNKVSDRVEYNHYTDLSRRVLCTGLRNEPY